jgi:hypothetical protein
MWSHSNQFWWMGMKRNQRRVKAILPLRITDVADGQHYLSHSVDISASGARLILPVSLDPGTQISLEYKHRRCKAVAVWSAPVGKNEYQIGLRLLNRDQCFWLVDLAMQEEDDFGIRSDMHWERAWTVKR